MVTYDDNIFILGSGHGTSRKQPARTGSYTRSSHGFKLHRKMLGDKRNLFLICWVDFDAHMSESQLIFQISHDRLLS